MRILILGYDKLGAYLATALASEDHKIMVMDTNPDHLDTLPQDPKLEAVLASGTLMDDLRRVGIINVEVFFAVSEDDNKNVMAAQVASHIFHVPQVICRIGDPERGKFYKGLGIRVVCPTLVVVDNLMGALQVHPEAVRG